MRSGVYAYFFWVEWVVGRDWERGFIPNPLRGFPSSFASLRMKIEKSLRREGRGNDAVPLS